MHNVFFIFSPETYHAKNQINARMFGDEYGVSEDPATGSANGSLAGYLVKHNYLGKLKLRFASNRDMKSRARRFCFCAPAPTGKALTSAWVVTCFRLRAVNCYNPLPVLLLPTPSANGVPGTYQVQVRGTLTIEQIKRINIPDSSFPIVIGAYPP